MSAFQRPLVDVRAAHSRPVTTLPGPPGAPDVLREARDTTGSSPSQWAQGALAACPGPILELTQIPASPGRRVLLRRIDHAAGGGRCLGHGGGHPPGVAGPVDPAALPVATNSAGAILATTCLQSVEELDQLFGELRRALRPSGTLVALLPARPGHSPAELRTWRPLRRALGPWFTPRHSSARDHPGWLFAAADFALLLDARRTFWLPLPEVAAAHPLLAGLITAGVLPLGPPDGRLAAAATALARRAGLDRRIPISMRLVVGRR